MSLDFADTLERLRSGAPLTKAEAAQALTPVLEGTVSDAAMTEFLVLLSEHAPQVEEMDGFLDAMLAHAETFEVDADAMDVVGTGGDGHHTVNISTMAAVTVAACGVVVVKHGNRAATSRVGAADVLEGLGVRIDGGPDEVRRCVDRAGIGFCFAPRFHSGLRHLGPIRRALGRPTVFNLLGPLANPARVQRLVVGVANAAALEPVAAVLGRRAVKRAEVVCGDDGLDELSPGAPSAVASVVAGSVTRSMIDGPAVLGHVVPASALEGGDLADNVRAFREYLSGSGGPVADAVALNAGLALVAASRADDLASGVEVARAAARDGRAARVFDLLVAASNA